MRKKSSVIRNAVMGAFLACLMAVSADAALVLTLDDPTTIGVIDVIVIDDQVPSAVSDSGLISTDADGSIGTAGLISFSGALGTATVDIAIGTSKPLITGGRIDLNSYRVDTISPGTIIMSLTDTGFGSATSAPTQVSAIIGGTTDGTVSFSSTYDPDDVEFGNGDGDDVTIGSTASGNPFSETVSASIGALPGDDNIFSLTSMVTITHDEGNSLTTLDHLTLIDVEIVPEPATMALFGLGGLMMLPRRRK